MTATTESDVPAVTTEKKRRTSRSSPSLWVLAGLYLVVLVVVAAFTDLESPWMSDDGAYGSQVRIIEETGSWGYTQGPSWGTPPTVVPTLGKSTVIDGVEYPYVKHPVWIGLLRASDRLGLPMVAANLVAALAAAVFAGRLAGQDPRARTLAFAAVALGPPLVWSTGLWAHAVAAALGGAIAFGLVRWRETASPRWVVLIAVAGGSLVLARSEGLLAVGAAASVLLADAWQERSNRSRAIRSVVGAATVGVAAAAARVIEGRVVESVAPGRELVLPSSGSPFVDGRISGFEATFLSGGFQPRPYVLGLLAVVLLAVGGALIVQRRTQPIGPLLVLVGVVLVALRAVTGWDKLIPGVLAAVPLVPLGLLMFRWRRAQVAERTLAVFAAVYAAGVVATQYPDGGATEWGGRFMAPALVALVVLAAGALTRAAEERAEVRGPASGRVLFSVAAALVFLPLVPALGSTQSNRSIHATIAADLRAADVDAAIATYPTLPLLLWPTVEDIPWTVTGDTAATSLAALVTSAREAGEQRLAVVGIEVDPAAVENLGFDVDQRSPNLLVLVAS